MIASLLNGTSNTPLVTDRVPVAPLLVSEAVNVNVPATRFVVSDVIVIVPAAPLNGVFHACPARFVTPAKPPATVTLSTPSGYVPGPVRSPNESTTPVFV